MFIIGSISYFRVINRESVSRSVIFFVSVLLFVRFSRRT